MTLNGSTRTQMSTTPLCGRYGGYWDLAENVMVNQGWGWVESRGAGVPRAQSELTEASGTESVSKHHARSYEMCQYAHLACRDFSSRSYSGIDFHYRELSKNN